MTRAITWTEAHRREALRRCYELAAELAATDADAAVFTAETAHHYTGNEDRWRGKLWRAGLDPARIDREVRRVDALATGRLVRETRWRVVYPDGSASQWPDRNEAAEEAQPNKWRKRARIVRVTRIRRAP